MSPSRALKAPVEVSADVPAAVVAVESVEVSLGEDAIGRSAVVTVDNVEDAVEDPIFCSSLPLRMCPNASPAAISMAKYERTLILKRLRFVM